MAAAKYITRLWANLDPLFFEIGWQREGSGTQKNFWNSMSKQTREKGKNLKCNNGVRHKKYDDGARLQNQKMLSYKQKGRTGLWRHVPPAFFAVPLPSLCLIFTNL